ncbi:hypothetical protein Drose_17625 [Dactylosporangium roseum]|uniref:Glycosyltransferase RgtA/B/C/D-like domain-containing protein n=1 Tax=Dactylosporangium roseum TaxID=47989 RepID=A0ABY5ZCK7_9ACTN|nr:hypothetical protein [Dactylosporangium roseum]UWZ39863.1 hypothetical protein Drose_17625 [Dactylosporangium roseum]
MSATLGGVPGSADPSVVPDAGIPRQSSTTAAPTPAAAPVVAPVHRPDRPARQRLTTAGLLLSGLAVMVLGYLRMARAKPVNADAGANALQAWDMVHGNVLLRGWTLSDVSFYTTELVQYAIIEFFYGLDPDVVHVASTSTYTLLIVFAALVAKGAATGRAGWARAGLAVAALLVPVPDSGWAIVLYAPNHTGTAVPLLVTWLLVDRRAGTPLRRWWPAGVAGLLAIAQVGDPLALFVGALPLAGVSALRLLRDRTWRGADAHLLVAAVGSIAVAHGVLALIWRAGGFSVHAPIAQFSPLGEIPGHLRLAAQAIALNYGAYFPHFGDAPVAPLAVAAGVVSLGLLILAAAAVGTVTVRALRGPWNRPPVRGRAGAAERDRVAELLVAAILVNLGAFVVSTQADGLLSARQIVVVLPFGAALAGRVWGDRLAALATRPVTGPVTGPAGSPALPRLVLGTLAGVLVAAFAVQAATATPQPAEGSPAADWLVANDLRYGLGGYWAANSITLATRGAVRVAPVIGPDIRSFRWESNADWYDATRHDARFVVVDLDNPVYGTVEAVVDRFGPPVERQDLDRWVVLVYDRNLLVDLPAQCGGLAVATHTHCPPLRPRIPGASLITGRPD